MNLLLKFIYISSLVSCTGKQSIKYITDLEQAGIKGDVAKLETKTYKVDSLGQVGELNSETIEIFNRLGYTMTDTARDFIEKTEVVESLEYNRNGSLSLSSVFENGEMQSKMVLDYDKEKCTGIKIYSTDNKLESYYGNIQQNEFGLLTGMSSYDAGGKLTMSYANEYDSIYQIGSTVKNSAGMLISESGIQLTDKKYPKNLLEVTYIKDSVTKIYFSYKYENWDTAGNWISQTVFNEKGKAVKFVKRIFSYKH